MPDRILPAPVTGPESRPFWDAAAEGRLVLKRCGGCGRRFWYPRALCPACFSAETEWVDAPTTGVIYSVSVMRRAKVPYGLAYVTLDGGGPTLMTNVVAGDLDALAIGQPVRLAFMPAADGSSVPVFEPA